MKNLFVAFLISFSFAEASDTLRLMQYNILDYGNSFSTCTSNNNNLADKDGYLKTIVDEYRPDIIGVNEMNSNVIYAQRILVNVLNTDSVNYFQRATYSNQSGSSLVNMLFYDSRKLTLYEEHVVPTSVRDINIYTLYYNDSALSSGTDTLFVSVVLAHLKAGSSSADQSQRQNEVSAAMTTIKSLNLIGNLVFMGDFNMRSSNEAAYQLLVNESDPDYRFYDPINRPGTWNNSSSFADLHTQSTRTSSGCGAAGGMDDRFDQILCTSFLLGDSLKAQYIPGSYWAIGQDGNRFNGSISSPTNNSAPADVIQALGGMSDHLPVILDLELDATAILSLENNFETRSCNAEIRGDYLVSEEEMKVEVIDALGRSGGTFYTTLNARINLKDFLQSDQIFFLKASNSSGSCASNFKFLLR